LTSERRPVGEGFSPAATGLFASRLVRWTTWEMALALGLAAAAILGSRAWSRWITSDETVHRLITDDAARWFVCSTGLNAVFLLVPLALLVFHHRKPLLSTLIPGNRIAEDFGWGLSLGLIVASFNALAVQRAVSLWAAQGPAAGGHPGYYKMIFEIGRVQPGAEHVDFMRPLLLFTMSWGVFSPIAEEVFFRGFLYGALRRRMRAPLAVLLSAAVFSLFHYPSAEPMAAAMVLGVVVAVVYEYSGSLLAPIMTHMAINLSFVLIMTNGGELARKIHWSVFAAAAVVFTVHFFLSSRYLFRKPR
jgi:membrane protease YdiL (CAAX protease family)